MILFLAYYFIFPIATKSHSKATRELRNIKNEFKTYKDILTSKNKNNGYEYINKLKEDNAKIKNSIAQYKDLILFIDAKIQSIDFIKFNKQNWSRTLYEITNKAQKNNINLTAFSNKLIQDKNTSGFSAKFSADINATGEFNDIMNFIHNIEKGYGVVDVNKIVLKMNKDKILTNISFKVWGVE